VCVRPGKKAPQTTARLGRKNALPNKITLNQSQSRGQKSTDSSVNLSGPNRSSVLTHSIRYLDSTVLVQFLPTRLISLDLNCAAVVAHPDFYNPLFVIGRPLIFDFLALFYRCHVWSPIAQSCERVFIAARQNNIEIFCCGEFSRQATRITK